MKAGVGIDPDRRAYHIFPKSGLTDDQINFYGFVYDPDAEGPSETLDPRKIQEAVLRFHDKPWDEDRHRDSRASMGRYLRLLMGHAATTHRHQTYHPGPGLATRAAPRKSPGKKKPSLLKMATSTRTGTNPSQRGNSAQPKSSMTGKRKLTWKPSWLESLTGSIGMCWTPALLTHTWRKRAVLTRACAKPIWGTRRHVESSAARTWFLARECDSCPGRPLSDAGCAEQ